MSKKQLRKTVSLNPVVFEAAKTLCSASGVTMSEYITRLVRADIPGIAAPTLHFDPIAREYRGRSRTAQAPVHRMSRKAVQSVLEGRKPEPSPAIDRATLDAMAARRRMITATCAHCGDYGPVTRQMHEGAVVNACHDCTAEPVADGGYRR